VGAFIADGQEGVALSDVGEGGGHGFTMVRFQQTNNVEFEFVILVTARCVII